MASTVLKRSPFGIATATWALQTRELCDEMEGVISEMRKMANPDNQPTWASLNYQNLLICHGEVRKLLDTAERQRSEFRAVFPVEILLSEFVLLGQDDYRRDASVFNHPFFKTMLWMEFEHEDLNQHMAALEATPVARALKYSAEGDQAQKANIMMDRQVDKNTLRNKRLGAMLVETAVQCDGLLNRWKSALKDIENLNLENICDRESQLYRETYIDEENPDKTRNMLGEYVDQINRQLDMLYNIIQNRYNPSTQATDMNIWLIMHGQEFERITDVLKTSLKELNVVQAKLEIAARKNRRKADEILLGQPGVREALIRSRTLKFEREELSSQNVSLRTEVNDLKEQLAKHEAANIKANQQIYDLMKRIARLEAN